jgi:hypothetical protein
MYMKITMLCIGIFALGFSCGSLILNQAVAFSPTADTEQPCEEGEKIFLQKEKMITLAPWQVCPSYDSTLSFTQNIFICDRPQLIYLDI